VGYSNLMYAVGEVKAPVRTIKIAGPLAIGTVSVLYLLTQIAYFAAVPREDIEASEQIIAALFFKNMFGESSARALSVFVALSAIANVFSVVFSQGRLNQALARDGLTPFSKILASNRPFKAPLAGITWHVIVTLIILLAPPAGDVSATI
jgi:amino acid transporter